MIVSHERRLLIATPSKCGSKSWDAAALKFGMELVRPGRHRMVPPEGCEDYRRAMIVRNPYDRLVSIYSMFATPYNETQWGAKRVQADDMTFDDFVTWFSDEKDVADLKEQNTFRAPHLWTNSNSQNALLWRPEIILHLESPEISCRVLDTEFGIKLDPSLVPHRHKSPARGSTPIEDWYVNRHTLALANAQWANDDCREFGYEKMGG